MLTLTPGEYTARFADPCSCAVHMTEAADLDLPERGLRSHKYTHGRALIFAGAEGFSGAAALAANACERGGAGLTHLVVPRSIYSIAAIKCDGAVVTPLEADAAGGFAESAAETALPLLQKADACLIGPGLGRGKGARALLAQVLRHAACPLVVDADALTLLGDHLWMIDRCPAPLLLTPHEGEFRRIGGNLAQGRSHGALEFGAQHPNAVLLLKGFGTLVCRGDTLSVNPTGSPALAKGGTGDVLAGLLCALLAQGMDALNAARCGAYLHGLAGDLAAAETGPYSLTPSDVIRYFPQAFQNVMKTGQP